MKKSLICLVVLFLSLFTSSYIVKAKDSKDGYIYSYWGEPIPSALGLTHKKTYDGLSINASMDSPEDIYAFNNRLYIVDSAKNSLIILDKDFNKDTVIEVTKFLSHDDPRETCVLSEDKKSDTLEEDLCSDADVLKSPSGIAVTKDAIYIADTSNHRIVKLNHDFRRIAEFGTPNDKTFQGEKPIKYEPLKVAVDKTNRIYVIARNVFEGIMELNSDGTFNRFTGVNPVTVNVVQALQRRFMTEAQLSQMSLFLPTSFTNMTIDDSGFIYTTAAASSTGDNTSMIKAINPKGLDVLKRNGFTPPLGDLRFAVAQGEVEKIGPSKLVDITLNDKGMYTVLDQLRGKLFTYDNEGRLLYISADKKLQTPVAITYFGEQIVLVDRMNKSLEVYAPTEFGELVNKAVEFHYLGEFEQAAETWKEVAKLNTNYEIAYVGIGKSLLRQQKYKEAMENFKLGKDKDYYAKAFEGYRKEIINDNFSLIMTGISITVLVFLRKPIIELFKGDKEDRE